MLQIWFLQGNSSQQDMGSFDWRRLVYNRTRGCMADSLAATWLECKESRCRLSIRSLLCLELSLAHRTCLWDMPPCYRFRLLSQRRM